MVSLVQYPDAVKVVCRWCGLVFRVRGKKQICYHEENTMNRADIPLCNNGCLTQWVRLYRWYRDTGVLQHGDFEKAIKQVPFVTCKPKVTSKLLPPL